MNPDDQRHATGIASGWQIQIESLAAVAGLPGLRLAIRLVAEGRHADGIRGGRPSGRRQRRIRWPRGGDGHLRDWHRGWLFGGGHGHTGSLLDRRFIDREAASNAAPLRPPGDATARRILGYRRNLHACGRVGRRTGILPPGQQRLRKRVEQDDAACQQAEHERAPRRPWRADGTGVGGRVTGHTTSIHPITPRARPRSSAAGPDMESDG